MVWIIVFTVVSLMAGFLTAGLLLTFMSVGTGFSELGKGWFLFLGLFCSLGFFAWQMSIRERFRMMSNRPGQVGEFRAKIEAEKKRAEDPFYEPSHFPWREGTTKPVIDPSWGVPPDIGDGSTSD